MIIIVGRIILCYNLNSMANFGLNREGAMWTRKKEVCKLKKRRRIK